MVESRAAVVIAALERCSGALQTAIKAAPDSVASPDDQRDAENAVAAGIALLASEDAPEPATQASSRETLAADLVITVDLVLRAVRAQPTD